MLIGEAPDRHKRFAPQHEGGYPPPAPLFPGRKIIRKLLGMDRSLTYFVQLALIPKPRGLPAIKLGKISVLTTSS